MAKGAKIRCRCSVVCDSIPDFEVHLKKKHPKLYAQIEPARPKRKRRK